MRKGWIVRANRKDGSETPWCASLASLADSLRATGTPLNPPEVRVAWQRAVAQLKQFAGHRVVIFDGKPDSFYVAQLSEMRNALVQVYLVDGGVIQKQQVSLDPIDDQGNLVPGSLSMTNEVNVRRRSYDNGLVHERNLNEAVKDAIKDAGGSYDLSLGSWSDMSAGTIPLHLELVDLYGISAAGDVYTVANQDHGSGQPVAKAPGLIVSRRESRQSGR